MSGRAFILHFAVLAMLTGPGLFAGDAVASNAILYDRDGNIYAADIDGSDEMQLTSGAHGDYMPSISPDATTIAFSRDYDLYLMNQDGGEQRLLVSKGDVGGNNVHDSDWTLDGEWIYFNAVSGCCSGGLYKVRLDGTGLVQVKSGYISAGLGIRRSLGDRVIFSQRRSGLSYSQNVRITDLDGGNEEQVTGGSSSESSATFGTCWSPDGQRFAYNYGHQHIYVANYPAPYNPVEVKTFDSWHHSLEWLDDNMLIWIDAYDAGPMHALNVDTLEDIDLGIVGNNPYVGARMREPPECCRGCECSGDEGIRDFTWQLKSPMGQSRSHAASVALDGKIYVIGGYVGGHSGTAAVEEYDPATNTWTSKAPISNAVWGLRAAVANGKIYVFGGAEHDTFFSTVQEYDPTTDAWTTKSPMSEAKYNMAIGVFDDKIYVIGGTRGDIAFDAVEEYDPLADTWTTKTAMPIARHLTYFAATSEKIYLFGDPTYVYNMATDSWCTKAAPPFDNVGAPAAAAINAKIYVFGGSFTSGGTGPVGIPDVYEYDPCTDTWSSKTGMVTGAALLWQSASVMDNKVYVLGGQTAYPTQSTTLVQEGTLESAGWTLGDGWTYRKPLTITNSVEAVLYDYSMKINLNTAHLIAQGKMQSDCGDIRIVENGQALSYGVRNCNSENTEIYFIANDLAVGDNNDIYIYYGNPDADNGFVGNWKDAFYIWYDDFDTDRGWYNCPGYEDRHGSVTVDTVNGWLYAAYGSYKDYRICPTDGSSFPMNGRVGFKAETRIMAENDNLCQISVELGDSNSAPKIPIIDFRVGHNDYIILWDSFVPKNLDDDVWYEATAVYNRLTGQWYGEFAGDGVRSGTRPAQPNDDFSTIVLDICNGINMYLDYLYLRYFIEPEPGYSLGTEEAYSAVACHHDQCVDAIAVQANEPYYGSTACATGTETSSCAYKDHNDVWHSFTPDYDYEYIISLCGSAFDTTLAVFDECSGTELACNDDTKPGICSSTLQSQLTMSLAKGSTYLVRIAGYDGETGDYVLTITGPKCIEYPAMDFDRDCKVGLRDLAIFCQSWLECNLDPPDLCGH